MLCTKPVSVKLLQ